MPLNSATGPEIGAFIVPPHSIYRRRSLIFLGIARICSTVRMHRVLKGRIKNAQEYFFNNVKRYTQISKHRTEPVN